MSPSLSVALQDLRLAPGDLPKIGSNVAYVSSSTVSDRAKKLVKLSVVLATTEQFVEHAAVADGASDLFVQLFGTENGHVRMVYGVQSLPIGTPVILEVIFEIK